ncbi:MAG: hypothetical protein M3282_12535 [Gemmatimonadota bacterium]|nr:hypothetical protein [Gemmatimonadota bacterium]
MKQSDAQHEIGGIDLGLGALLYGVLGGPIAWTLHLFVSYFLVALACTTGWWGANVGIALATVLLAAAAGASVVVSFRRWRQLGGDQRWDEALSDPRGRGGFLWVLGMVLGAIFALAILFAGLPPLFVPTCGAGSRA